MSDRASDRHRWKTPSCPSLPRLSEGRLTDGEWGHTRTCKYCQQVLAVAALPCGCEIAAAKAAKAGMN
jgi:hypothetical protein